MCTYQNVPERIFLLSGTWDQIPFSSEIRSLLSLALAGYNAVLKKWHRGPPLAARVHLAACPAFSDREQWRAS